MSLDLDALRSGLPDCPSDLALDRLEAGELPPAERQALEAHAAGCPGCTARLASRRAGFAAFPELDERKLLAALRRAEPQASPWTPLWAELGGLAALAAAVALGLWVKPSGLDLGEAGLRAKGSLGLHVYRLRGEQVEAAVSGDTFAEGDRLRFAVDLLQPGRVRVLGVEQSGALYTAWPLDPALPTQRQAGPDQPLPGAVTLDGSPGQETLYLAWCPVDAGEPRCAAPARAGDRPTCQPGCLLTPFVLRKGP
jgi:hypothetical protein